MLSHTPCRQASAQQKRRLMIIAQPLNEKKYRFWPWLTFAGMAPRPTRTNLDIAMLFPWNAHEWLEIYQGPTFSTRTIKAPATSTTVIKEFVDRYHTPKTGLYYGGHGEGDALSLYKNHRLPISRFAKCLGEHVFDWMLFDSCYMANLDVAFHLRHNTRWIGASQGAVWGHFADMSQYMLNPELVAMIPKCTPLGFMHQVKANFVQRSPHGDFAILDTRGAAALKALQLQQPTKPFDFHPSLRYLHDVHDALPKRQQSRIKQVVRSYSPSSQEGLYKAPMHGLSFRKRSNKKNQGQF